MACGSQKVQSTRAVDTECTIGNESYNVQFQEIPGINEDVILGLEFIKNEMVVIDIPGNRVYIGRDSRQTVFFSPEHRERGMMLKLPETLQVPPELENLFEDYKDIFNYIPGTATTKTVRHEIVLTSDKRVYQRPYPLSPQKKVILDEQVQDMLEQGIIEPSTSPFSSPPVIVERPGKKPRFCVDYRQLNQISVDEAAVLPKIQETLKEFGTAKIFSTLDLQSGYWQIPMADSSKKYTAFSTPDGAVYQFKVMPFGLKNAPATFQNLMVREVLTGYINKFVHVYLDDIIIYSDDMEKHRKHLALVFERLRLHNLKVSPEKCNIAQSNLDYLGYKIIGDYTSPQEKHLQALQTYPEPRTRTQVQKFLGLLNWVREYLPNAAELIKPITGLLRKDSKFKWDAECQGAFEAIKQVLSQPLKLSRPDYNHPFVLQTDASLKGLAAVVYQEIQGERRIISYHSTTLNKTEQKLHINELEVLAVIVAIKRYRNILQDERFILRTDSRALEWLNKCKDSKAKLTRWSLLLQEYNYEVQHCPATQNQLADYLSRHPENKPVPDIEEDRLYLPKIRQLTQLGLYERVKEAQQHHRATGNLLARRNAVQHLQVADNPENRHLADYRVKNMVLYRATPDGDKLYVPPTMTAHVIHHHHDTPESAHPGYEETVNQVQRRYYFPRMRREIQAYVKNCLICAAVKPHRLQPRAPLKPHTPREPMEILSVDILGPYIETPRKNRYIIIAEDVLTKWVEAVSVPVADADAVVEFLNNEIFARYGYPRTIISDNARIFQGRKYTRLCESHGIQIYFSPVYHQQSNPVERRVQELKKVLRALLHNQRRRHRWDQQLPRALHILRGRKNAAIGMSPSEAFLGYRLPREGEWEIPEYIEERRRQQTRPTRIENMIQRQLDFQTKWYNTRERPQITFRVGQRVMTRESAPNPGEMENAWSGPHIVTTKLSDEVYEVEKNGSVVNIHVNDLRLAPRGNQPPPEDEEPPEEPEEGFPDPPEPPEPPEQQPRLPPDRNPESSPTSTSTREISGSTYIHRGRPTRLVVRD